MAKSKNFRFEVKLLIYLLVATVTPTVLLLITLFYYDASLNLISLIVLMLIMVTGISAAKLYQKLNFQFLTLSNLLEAITQGEYSLRGRYIRSDDALGQLIKQINELSDTLSMQKTKAAESEILVDKIVRNIPVAIIALDSQDEIVLVNPEAKKLLQHSEEEILAKQLKDFNIEFIRSKESNTVQQCRFPQRSGHFQITYDKYQEQGRTHTIYFITDVKILLRAQEREAWQKLVRVLSHEINNSLTPISSLAETLQKLASKQKMNEDFSENLTESLLIIKERSNSLKSFIESYRKLTHLPEPQLQPVNLKKLVDSILSLFPQRKIESMIESSQILNLDSVQIEQALINLIKNAHEAMSDINGVIKIKTYSNQNSVEIVIEDEGVGINNIDNVFTPFYSTKPNGSGIGLALTRQIIEAHNGFIRLENREDRKGCRATIELLTDG